VVTRVPTVVLIHGAGCDHHAMGPLAEALAARGVKARAIDLPGRGASPGPAATTACAAAERIAATIPEGAVVLGHSYGSAVAIELALLGRPIAGLVLAASGARLRVHPAILETMRAAEAAGPASPPTAAWIEGVAPRAVVESIDRAARAVPSTTTRIDWEAVNAFDRLGTIDAVRCPTLILAGTADTLTPPKYARYLAEHIAGAELALLDGVGHWCLVEAAERAADHIRTFVSKLGG
jgi:pimeloyl-ACP methyl ester carboxylesterase